MVERFFSQTKRFFSPHRRRLNIRTLEVLLFLNRNRQLWNLSTVASVVSERDEAELDEEHDSEVEDDHKDQVW